MSYSRSLARTGYQDSHDEIREFIYGPGHETGVCFEALSLIGRDATSLHFQVSKTI